jgi:hypothetical protein
VIACSQHAFGGLRVGSLPQSGRHLLLEQVGRRLQLWQLSCRWFWTNLWQ